MLEASIDVRFRSRYGRDCIVPMVAKSNVYSMQLHISPILYHTTFENCTNGSHRANGEVKGPVLARSGILGD